MPRSAGARSGWKGERGSVAVEFILVFGLIAALLLITLDAGRLLNNHLVLVMAAREGARRAAIAGGDYPDVRAHIHDLAEAGRLSPQRLEVDIQPRRARYGTTVVVSLGYKFQTRAPFLATILGPEVDLNARVVARSERLAPRE